MHLTTQVTGASTLTQATQLMMTTHTKHHTPTHSTPQGPYAQQQAARQAEAAARTAFLALLPPEFASLADGDRGNLSGRGLMHHRAYNAGSQYINSLQDRIQEMGDQNEDLEDAIEKCESENDKIKNETERLTAEKEMLENTIESLQKELQEAQRKVRHGLILVFAQISDTVCRMLSSMR